jgi:hypothetical protein
VKPDDGGLAAKSLIEAKDSTTMSFAEFEELTGFQTVPLPTDYTPVIQLDQKELDLACQHWGYIFLATTS